MVGEIAVAPDARIHRGDAFVPAGEGAFGEVVTRIVGEQPQLRTRMPHPFAPGAEIEEADHPAAQRRHDDDAQGVAVEFDCRKSIDATAPDHAPASAMRSQAAA